MIYTFSREVKLPGQVQYEMYEVRCSVSLLDVKNYNDTKFCIDETLLTICNVVSNTIKLEKELDTNKYKESLKERLSDFNNKLKVVAISSYISHSKPIAAYHLNKEFREINDISTKEMTLLEICNALLDSIYMQYSKDGITKNRVAYKDFVSENKEIFKLIG